jgi:hypothetical protein
MLCAPGHTSRAVGERRADGPGNVGWVEDLAHRLARGRRGRWRGTRRLTSQHLALWPRTIIATAAVRNLLGGDEAMARSRKPELYADAAYAVITRPSRECTGNTYLCEDVLAEEGITDLEQYAYVTGAEPQVDLYVDRL